MDGESTIQSSTKEMNEKYSQVDILLQQFGEHEIGWADFAKAIKKIESDRDEAREKAHYYWEHSCGCIYDEEPKWKD